MGSLPVRSTSFYFFLLLLLVSSKFDVVAVEGASQRGATQIDRVGNGGEEETYSVDMNAGRHADEHQRTWQEQRLFNASEHEVPSGPNPISNRTVIDGMPCIDRLDDWGAFLIKKGLWGICSQRQKGHNVMLHFKK
ncbi:hypothetical protein H6P81_019470 [Aristolochia fimbriata]|uniref:Uncharacterized protein n=1 Tax=Aristolochia fimbriata TaxID=158543 RepID=A0AAV7DRT6_ARIFI|nr:hypothetical protein H6P81_019470 [Aristolochia fimbriata]